MKTKLLQFKKLITLAMTLAFLCQNFAWAGPTTCHCEKGVRKWGQSHFFKRGCLQYEKNIMLVIASVEEIKKMTLTPFPLGAKDESKNDK